jgi:hypothetical protein
MEIDWTTACLGSSMPSADALDARPAHGMNGLCGSAPFGDARRWSSAIDAFILVASSGDHQS